MAEGTVRILSIRLDSIVNETTVTVAPNPAEPTPTPQTTQDITSQDNYGVQTVAIVDSLLATDEDAELLADYLLRPDPNFWYTGLSVNMHRLTSAQRATMATLEIGSFVSVTKSYTYGYPSSVQKNLYVEGITHRITPAGHIMELYFSPVGFSQEWQNVTADVQWEDVADGLSWANLIWTIL
jgi:hypothetical protein